MSFYKKYVRIIGLIFSISLVGVLIGCNAAGQTNSTGGGSEISNGEPVSGGTLKIAYSAEPDTIDWMYTGATATRDVGWHIFESLFALDKDYEVRPMIAEDLEISDDQTLYTITIRPDVNFHNGEVVTVEDVIASIERWRSISHVGQIANAFIESVEAIDDVTIEIQLNEVYNSLLDDFAAPKSALMIIPQAIAEEAGEQPLQPEQLVGTGPYEFKEWNKGHELILTKYDDYSAREEADWGGLTGEKVAYFDEIKFQIVKDPQVGMNGVKT